jgi:hypothetical protein
MEITANGTTRPVMTMTVLASSSAIRTSNPTIYNARRIGSSLRQKRRVSRLGDEVQVLRKWTCDRNLKELCGLRVNDEGAAGGEEDADLILHSP